MEKFYHGIAVIEIFYISYFKYLSFAESSQPFLCYCQILTFCNSIFLRYILNFFTTFNQNENKDMIVLHLGNKNFVPQIPKFQKKKKRCKWFQRKTPLPFKSINASILIVCNTSLWFNNIQIYLCQNILCNDWFKECCWIWTK